jgi:hypothetical protein
MILRCTNFQISQIVSLEKLEIIKELYWIILLIGRYRRWCDINEMMCLSVKETWAWIVIGLWCYVGHVFRKFENLSVCLFTWKSYYDIWKY